MGLINMRELIPLPVNPSNTSEIIINDVHFNRTALEYWNYTLYSNNTISNSSKCYIIFDQFKPIMFANGSWVNATSCYIPYYHIKTRGGVGIGFAAFFAASIMFALICLRKHGKLYLREDKRFRVVGRRWQWYWMSFVAACGIISCITGVDVDRNYTTSIAIVLQSFFFSLMLPGTLAMVWESVRHWGSWEERQICDEDPYKLPQDDRRSQTEFWLPLVFYLFAWMNFFMVIPRSWGKLEKQRDPTQITTIAEPSGTDNRLKAGGIIATVAWIVIWISLFHSLYWYTPRVSGGGFWRRFDNFAHHCPTKHFLTLIILAIRIAYSIAISWEWNISIFNQSVDPVWPYTLGYGTTALIMVILIVYGFIEENEDKVLIQRRRDRGRSVDAEIGIVKKPSWWSKMSGDHRFMTAEQRLRALTTEVGGGAATDKKMRDRLSKAAVAITGAAPVSVELGNMPRNRSRGRDSILPAPENPFRDDYDPSPYDQPTENNPRFSLPRDYDPTPYDERHRRSGSGSFFGAGATVERGRDDSSMSGGTVDRQTSAAPSSRTGLSGTTVNDMGQPVRVRSMLDI